MKTATFFNLLHDEIGMCRTTFYELLKTAAKSGVLHKDKTSETWEVSTSPSAMALACLSTGVSLTQGRKCASGAFTGDGFRQK